jgi:hypothetical protein
MRKLSHGEAGGPEVGFSLSIAQLTTSAFTGTNPATEATAPGLRFIVRVHNLRNGV